MRASCRNCGRILVPMEMFRGCCSILDECLIRVRVNEGPPDEEPAVSEWDLPPDDLNRCSTCAGSGKVFTSVFPQWEGGARPTALCPRCEGARLDPTVIS